MIRVEGLSKAFYLYKKPSDRLKEIVLRKSYHIKHQALRDISFAVDDGETLGIIGMNGSGKSTLLKILTGVLLPDSGNVQLSGKITGLLELGIGFNLELSGIQNVYTNGMLLGMVKEEIDQKLAMIVDFSELGDFVEEPVKTYSSGMLMRLAFATAIHAEPKCFVIDEALSVGDAYFQQKCMNRIKEFRQNGGSIIFVSHDMNAVKKLCDKALLLDKGIVVEQGEPDQVVNSYNFLIARANDSRLTIKNKEHHAYGTLEAEIIDVVVTGERSHSANVSAGEEATISVILKVNTVLDDITVGILIRDKFGQDIFGTNSHFLKKKLELKKNCLYEIKFTLRMDIGPGKYTVTAAAHSKDTHVEKCYHWFDSIKTFEVSGNYGEFFAGICKLYPTLAYFERSRYVRS